VLGKVFNPKTYSNFLSYAQVSGEGLHQFYQPVVPAALKCSQPRSLTE